MRTIPVLAYRRCQLITVILTGTLFRRTFLSQRARGEAPPGLVHFWVGWYVPAHVVQPCSARQTVAVLPGKRSVSQSSEPSPPSLSSYPIHGDIMQPGPGGMWRRGGVWRIAASRVNDRIKHPFPGAPRGYATPHRLMNARFHSPGAIKHERYGSEMKDNRAGHA